MGIVVRVNHGRPSDATVEGAYTKSNRVYLICEERNLLALYTPITNNEWASAGHPVDSFVDKFRNTAEGDEFRWGNIKYVRLKESEYNQYCPAVVSFAGMLINKDEVIKFDKKQGPIVKRLP